MMLGLFFEQHLKTTLKANNNFLTDFSSTSTTELECLNTSIRTEGNPSSPKKLMPFFLPAMTSYAQSLQVLQRS